jgi:acetate kinase
MTAATAGPAPTAPAVLGPGDPILAINCGSSSLKYAVFAGDDVIARATVDGVTDHGRAVRGVLDGLAARPAAVGHRLVHGGPDHSAPARVDPALLAALARLVPLSPLHLPAELAAIEAVSQRLGDLPQVVCFDTAFHHTLPMVARRVALPAALFDAGIRRYGFHGLSYASIAAALPAARLRRAVIAHLGSGASMAAIRDGRSVETTMGFSPAGGLVMATRAGDLDPGLLVYLQGHGYDARRLDHLINHEAGLLALSETTADMQQLLARRAADPRAALAVDTFCYHARKAIGALAAVLGGLDTLVFTGGIGEHAAEIRAEICHGLAHLGIALDADRNATGAPIISPAGTGSSTGSCEVRVMRTDEEREIARATRHVLEAPPAL